MSNLSHVKNRITCFAPIKTINHPTFFLLEKNNQTGFNSIYKLMQRNSKLRIFQIEYSAFFTRFKFIFFSRSQIW